MKIYVFEDNRFSDFFPITTTRAVFDVRIGRSTFLERIIKVFSDCSVSLIVRDDLKEIVSERHPNFSVNPDNFEDAIWISGSVMWSKEDVKKLLEENTAFMYRNRLVGVNISSLNAEKWNSNGGPLACLPNDIEMKEINVNQCNYLWDIIKSIGNSIEEDVIGLDAVSKDNFSKIHLINPDKIFINNANIMPGTIINAEKGPVYIDKNVHLFGQSYIEGPVYIGPDTIISPLSKIKDTVIGSNCKIGGEVESSVIQGFSNKVHEGHLGDSFVGEWVNLGAGTSNSNLKNNYTSVKVQLSEELVDSNSLHIGCFIGDHVKTAIGTLINSGSVISPASMVSSYGFIPKTLPPFSWYVNRKLDKMDFNKFVMTAKKVKERRNQTFTSIEEAFYNKLRINIESN